MQNLTLVLAFCVLISLLFFSLITSIRKQSKRSEHELPGPTLLPYIGRIHDLPIMLMWTKFEEWAKIYGPIYRTEMLGTKFIIVSDAKVVDDLLVKRAKTYSDRPAVRSLVDSKSTFGSMEYLPLMGRNQYWARQRKWTHASLTFSANHQYHGVVDHEVKRWMVRLLTDPNGFYTTLEDMASKVTCTLNWDNPDYSMYNTKSAWGLLTQMSPAGPITNVLTPLWHLPHAVNPWKIAETKRHAEQQDWWMKNLVTSRAQFEKGELRPCWTRQYLESIKKTGLSGDYEASSVIGMIALVGVFTIAGPLNYFLVAMVHHPQWQAKCQKEVDEVCGDRLPDLGDFARLPILRACIKETMRWRPNVPTGVAHEVEADDFYNGFFIAKGTRILPLDTALLKDPKMYPDPDSFRPDRWLESSWPTYKEPLTEFPNIMGLSSFGYGQRACLGQRLTQDELLVACGALSWLFNMDYKVDPATGEKIDVSTTKCNSLLIVKPDPFEMAFHPRSEAKAARVKALWADSDAKDKDARANYARAARGTVV